MTVTRALGAVAYWLAWPLYQVYFRFGDRTRIVLISDGKVLAMRQWIGTGRWSLPGGGLHRGETPEHGALRELREETGIDVPASQLAYVGRAQYRQHGQHFTYHVFVCELASPGPLRRQWYEVASLAWLSAAELTPRTASNDTLGSLRLVRARTRLLQ